MVSRRMSKVRDKFAAFIERSQEMTLLVLDCEIYWIIRD